MKLITSALGSLPRSEKTLKAFRSVDAIYLTKEHLDALNNYANVVIRAQEEIGLDIINDGEVQRSGYYSAFYNSFTGYMPTAIKNPVIMDDGHCWSHQERRSYKVWESPWLKSFRKPEYAWSRAIVVEKLQSNKLLPFKSVFHLEASTLKSYKKKKKITLPTPYQIMRKSFHPVFSKEAYATKEEYLDDLVNIFTDIVGDLVLEGIDVIQFDDDVITLFLDPAMHECFDYEKELELFIESTNRVTSGLKKIESATHICRAIIHKDISWTSNSLLKTIFNKLNIDQISVAFNDTDDDYSSLVDFPERSKLMLGVIYSNEYELEPPEVMLARLKHALKYVPIERVILTSNCGFSPLAGLKKGLDVACNKLRNMVMFGNIISESGLNEHYLQKAGKEFLKLQKQQNNLLEVKEVSSFFPRIFSKIKKIVN